MIKAIARSMKLAPARAPKPNVVSVGLDVFGNAVPEAKSEQDNNSDRATRRTTRIVRWEEVQVHPSRKRARKLARKALSFGAFGKLLPARRQEPAERLPVVARTGEVLDCEFREIKLVPQVLNEGEQRLEPRIFEANAVEASNAESPRKMPAQALPLAVAVAFVVFYLLHVMTGMESSMSTMSGNIQTMATDTRAMSQNMQAMNRNVEQMNQNVGAIAKSTAPMGEAASTVSPLTRMVKAILPF